MSRNLSCEVCQRCQHFSDSYLLPTSNSRTRAVETTAQEELAPVTKQFLNLLHQSLWLYWFEEGVGMGVSLWREFALFLTRD